MEGTTLEALAELVCGDFENAPVYRTGSQLTLFFERAGLPRFQHDGSTRKWWTLQALESCTEDEVELVIKRLASPHEYRGNTKVLCKTVDYLNQILQLEGKRVKLEGISPVVLMTAPAFHEEVAERPKPSLEPPDFSELNLQPRIASQLAYRWSEAERCVAASAHLAAIVMMGSLLEGMLLGIIQKNPAAANKAQAAPRDRGRIRRYEQWSLAQMIDVAHELQWIDLDVKSFSHSLRQFRNLIHPSEQVRLGAFPDADTCEIGWRVVRATVNDLAQALSG